MGSARLQGKKQALEPVQQKPDPSQGLGNQQKGTASRGVFKQFSASQERKAQEQAAAAALSAAEKAAAQKTAELANSAGGGVSINTNGQGSSSYTEGNPGQDDSQSQGDVDLSASDTTLRRRGGYRRDGGIRI